MIISTLLTTDLGVSLVFPLPPLPLILSPEWDHLQPQVWHGWKQRQGYGLAGWMPRRTTSSAWAKPQSLTAVTSGSSQLSWRSTSAALIQSPLPAVLGCRSDTSTLYWHPWWMGHNAYIMLAPVRRTIIGFGATSKFWKPNQNFELRSCKLAVRNYL